MILNEKEYAEDCLANGIVGVKPQKTLVLLAKYYYHNLGYRKKRIIKCLTEFMASFYPRYSIDRLEWDKTIEKIASNAGKHALYQNDGVWITESELNVINGLGNKELEKLAFTLLCIAKLNYIRNEKSNGWVNTDEKEVFQSAGIKCTGDERSDYIGDLYLADVIEFAKKNTNLNIRVVFMDCESEGVLFVPDFRALGNEYLKYLGGNYIRCQECGLLVPGNKNGTKKYCNACKGHPVQETKIISCQDCGIKMIVKSKNNQTCRCMDCNAKYRREKVKENMKNMRNKKKLLSAQMQDDDFQKS